ncbi:MAG TPA: quinolinate synthase NadA [Bacteroidales bacterium]|nr:quinolinate synthase NadA [Bacteroidales bacterium]HOR60127.1 quinolinate synthase NadA [Bacteroidales bacterium]HPL04578.1 quinolinate synthase NadA [Bacteroidales bacterium]
MNKSDLENFGFLKIEIPKSIDNAEEIKKFKKEKNAVILGHYYISGDLQDISDYVGDSLQLSQQAAETDADIIVFLGVHFMAETAKILSPSKKVLIPDLKASCSLAESCMEKDFAKFIKDNPGHTVISYVNTTAAIKALTDIIVTSSNAKQIVDSLPKDEKIIFGPDKNLGAYINNVTGRKMLLWNGACHVHKQFDLEAILKLKSENPDAKIIAHPECETSILNISEHIGSTSSLLKFTQADSAKKFIIATEPGILHQMQKASPNKIFIAPPSSKNAFNDCNFMKLNTMEKLYNCLKYELPEINIDEELRQKAEKSIIKMLEISKKLNIK